MPAYEQAPDAEEGLVNIITLLIANAKPSLLEQPSECAFDDPADLSEPAIVCNVG
jgi:hypothetical protein